MKNAPPHDVPREEPPNMPGFRTWRGLYLLVLGSLAFYVVLLCRWSRWFS